MNPLLALLAVAAASSPADAGHFNDPIAPPPREPRGGRSYAHVKAAPRKLSEEDQARLDAAKAKRERRAAKYRAQAAKAKP